jgi:hypothetical protein
MKMHLRHCCLALSFLIGTLPCYSAVVEIPFLGASDCQDIFQNSPGDYPFATEFSFVHFCQHHVNCNTRTIDPDQIKQGDLVYVADWYVEWFLKHVHPHIKDPYILVSGDSDGTHPGGESAELLCLYDPKIAAWFCKNFTLNHHPKCRIIPCGPTMGQWRWQRSWVEGYAIPKDNSDITYFDYYLNLVLSPKGKKEDYPLAYLNISPQNHPIRKQVIAHFTDKPFCYPGKLGISRPVYWDELLKFKFIIAPRGIGPDTARIWEGFALGTIPIVQHSPVDAIYEGMPITFVHSWEEVTEDLLNREYDRIQKGLNERKLGTEKIYFHYWAGLLVQTQNMIRKNQWNRNDLSATKFEPASLEILKKILLENTGNYNHLVVCGDAMSLRPFELVYNLSYRFCKTFVADQCMLEAPNHASKLAEFSKDSALFADPDLKDKMKYTSVKRLPLIVKGEPGWTFRVFMDLTYCQYNFTEQLSEIFSCMPVGTIICGNMVKNPYVYELLQNFCKQHPLLFMQQTGDFWHFTKER